MDQGKNTFLVEGGIKQQKKKKKHSATSLTGHTLRHSCLHALPHFILPKPEEMKVAQSCLTLQDTTDSPGQNTGVGSLSLLQGMQADSLPAEPPGKPKNTGAGSLSLLQLIFSTQESNQGLLHCRWTLYQLSY